MGAALSFIWYSLFGYNFSEDELIYIFVDRFLQTFGLMSGRILRSCLFTINKSAALNYFFLQIKYFKIWFTIYIASRKYLLKLHSLLQIL